MHVQYRVLGHLAWSSGGLFKKKSAHKASLCHWHVTRRSNNPSQMLLTNMVSYTHLSISLRRPFLLQDRTFLAFMPRLIDFTVCKMQLVMLPRTSCCMHLP